MMIYFFAQASNVTHETLHADATYRKPFNIFCTKQTKKKKKKKKKDVWYVFSSVHVKLVDILFAYQSKGP